MRPQRQGKKLVCVYIHPSTEEEAGWPLGGAAKLWLHDTLHDLSILLLKNLDCDYWSQTQLTSTMVQRGHCVVLQVN